MLNITLDTCVWLKLLHVDFEKEDNYFEEMCFWIENRHLNHVVPINIIDEWNRHKLNYRDQIVTYLKKKELDDIKRFVHNAELASTYNSEEIYKRVQMRIERVDLIFGSYSEKAHHDDLILKEAGLRNLRVQPPNHKSDSFRDTVNILSLISYLKERGHTNSIFATENYKDFSSESGKKHELHDGLKAEFLEANLTYYYTGDTEDFGKKLFHYLRSELKAHSFQKHLKDKMDRKKAEDLAAKKEFPRELVENPDTDFLENIKYIDTILAKNKRTAIDEEILRILIRQHESYERYFFFNVGDDGLV